LVGSTLQAKGLAYNQEDVWYEDAAVAEDNDGSERKEHRRIEIDCPLKSWVIPNINETAELN
jgi:hypothetical protein